MTKTTEPHCNGDPGECSYNGGCMYACGAMQASAPAPLEAGSGFDEWWEAHGQFCRAGGGDYEKTFAFHAWEAALATSTKPAPTAVRVHAYGGATGINDYAMTDGSIKAMRPAEVVWNNRMANGFTEAETSASKSVSGLTQPAPTAAGSEAVAWMIEFTPFPQPMWFTGREVGEFTTNPNEAIRFPTKEAAELILRTLRVERPRKFFRADLSCYAITEHLWCDTATSTKPAPAEPVKCQNCEVLEGELSDMTAERDAARDEPWPEWATQVLAMTRKLSGYDGYDDSDGVDIAAEVREAYAELTSQIERLRASRDIDMTSWNERIDRAIAALAAFSPQVKLSDAARDVLAERQRQVSVEGYTPEHDDEHRDGAMAIAAACYAAIGGAPSRPASEAASALWPFTGWDWKWWKPAGKRRNLIKAGALIVAEIERLDRAAVLATRGNL